MKLKDLVPSPDLCKQIPENIFLDAAFAWHYTDVTGFVCGGPLGCCQISGKDWQLVPSTSGKIIRARARGERIYPAPLLEEIMAAMPYCRVYKKTSGCFIAVQDASRHISRAASNSAFELWLERHEGDQ